jgi:hypothetical protein
MKRKYLPNTKPVSIKSVLGKFDFDRDKYISREFQKFGYDLASAMGDLKNKSLYIKLAKTTPRKILDQAISFVKDANNVRSKPRLFMWKIGELKKLTKGN